MPYGRCDGCGRKRIVTEIKITRKYSKDSDYRTIMFGGGRRGYCCKDCWTGKGFSSPVIYWP